MRRCWRQKNLVSMDGMRSASRMSRGEGTWVKKKMLGFSTFIEFIFFPEKKNMNLCTHVILNQMPGSRGTEKKKTQSLALIAILCWKDMSEYTEHDSLCQSLAKHLAWTTCLIRLGNQ